MGQVLSLAKALVWRRAHLEAGQPLVFTNGVFDLLHVGHVRYLQAARALGAALLVGLNDDASVRALKAGRPLVPQAERAEVLAALGCVDVVVVFTGVSAGELVAALRPEIYVKGGDWGRPGGPRPPEAEIVKDYDGRVVFLPYVPGHSTTDLVRRIADQTCNDEGPQDG